MKPMKAMLSPVLAAAVLVGVHATAAAQVRPNQNCIVWTQPAPASAIPPSLLALLQGNPSGGPTLAGAVTKFLLNDPSAAPLVVALAKQANPDQKAAIAQGYLRALARLKNEDGQCAQALRAALNFADPSFSAIIAALEGQNYAESGGHGATFFSPGGGGFAGGGTGFSPVAPNPSPH